MMDLFRRSVAMCLSKFRRDDRGAITVDWIVLTAAVVSLATAVGVLLNDGSETGLRGRLEALIINAVDGVGREDR